MSLAIFLLGFATRGVFVIHGRQYLHTDEKTEIVDVAHALASRGEFADPFKIPTGPTAHVSPAYPLLLAGIYRPLGVTIPAEIVKETLTISISALTCALLPFIAAAAGITFETGAIAGLLGAAIPIHPYIETKGEWEAPWTGLILGLLFLMTLYRWRNPARQPVRDAAVRGLAWGAALQFSPVLATVLVVFTLGEFAARRAFKPVAALVAIVVLVQAPWALRNWRTFHAFIPFRDNFGQEFFYGNHGGRYPVAIDALAKGDQAHFQPNCSFTAAQELAREGEVAWNSQKSHEAREWIARHPGGFIKATAEHAFYFWFPEVRLESVYSLLWLVTGLGFTGLAVLYRQNRAAFVPIAAMWLAYPLPYYLTLNENRYAVPLYWSQLLMAIYAVSWAVSRVRAADAEIPRAKAVLAHQPEHPLAG